MRYVQCVFIGDPNIPWNESFNQKNRTRIISNKKSDIKQKSPTPDLNWQPPAPETGTLTIAPVELMFMNWCYK